MKCPCCGAETPDKNISDKLWDYKAFSEWVKTQISYSDYKKYDLENYFMQVSLKCSELTHWKMIYEKMKFFILQDINSNGKFPVKYSKVEKGNDIEAAYRCVDANWKLIEAMNERNPIELIPRIKKELVPDIPHWHNPLFESYVERALRAYKLVD